MINTFHFAFHTRNKLQAEYSVSALFMARLAHPEDYTWIMNLEDQTGVMEQLRCHLNEMLFVWEEFSRN